MTNKLEQDDLICAFLDDELASKDVDALLAQLEAQDQRARCQRHSVARQAAQGAVCKIDISGQVAAAIWAEPIQVATQRRQVVRPLAWARARKAAMGSRPWGKVAVPASGFAMAASAALAAVLIVGDGNAPSQQPAQVAQADDAPSAVAKAPQTLNVASVAQPNLRPATQPQVPVSLVSHSNTARPASSRELVIEAPKQGSKTGGLSQARWAEYEPGQLEKNQRLNAYLINHARYGGAYALSGPLGYARLTANAQQANNK